MIGLGMRTILTATVLLTAATGAAQEPVMVPDRPPLVEVEATAGEPVIAEAAFGTDASLADGDLGLVAGRADTGTQIARADQRNTVSNNSVNGTSTTGSVQIDGNAFQNLQGLAVISANSGNNVAINSAMNVTINLGGPQ